MLLPRPVRRRPGGPSSSSSPTAGKRLRDATSLQIAGLVPLSTVDWPGMLAASVFLQGCPWRCPYCHNHAIIDTRTPGTVPWERVERLVQARRGLLDGVVFTGGEALRQPGLADAMRRVRAAGMKVGLHAAGAFPAALERLLAAGLIDWVGHDIKALPENYAQVAGRANAGGQAWRSLRALLDSGVDYEVRMTVYPDGPGDAVELAERLRDEGVAVLALQQARGRGAVEGFRADAPGWDRRVRAWAHRCEELGFDRFVFRPA